MVAYLAWELTQKKKISCSARKPLATPMRLTADNGSPSAQKDIRAADDVAQVPSTTPDAAATLTTPPAAAAPIPGRSAVGTATRLENGVEGEESVHQDQRPPRPANRVSTDRESEARVATFCNWGGNGSLDHPSCSHVQLYQIHVDAINVDLDNTNTQNHQKKTFAMWLMDEEHLADHAMFLLSLVFSTSLIMILTFAWLEADVVLAGVWWLWALLLALLLMMQSCTWLSFAVYSLWMYPVAYYKWKAEPQVPLRRPRSASRHRHRHRRRRCGSRDSSSRNSTATQTEIVLDADQRP